jgi:hypothetical protein
MSTVPAVLEAWLAQKVTNHRWARVLEARELHHSWSRSCGGRIMSAELHASIEPSEQFDLVVQADVEGRTYIEAVKDGCISALLASVVPVLSCRIVFSHLQPHPIQSSYFAFYHVAREATERMIGVAGHENNVAW